MNKAHVICCNDSIEYVVLDNEEQALIKLEEIARGKYEKFYKWEFEDYEEYRKRLYWHLHTVKYDTDNSNN